MTEILIVSLAFLLASIYILNKGNLASPSFHFTMGFFICSIMAYSFKDLWCLNICMTTYLVVVIGCVTYFLTEYLLFERKTTLYCSFFEKKMFYPISEKKMVVILLFQMIAFVLYAKAKMAYAGTSSLTDALSDINSDFKFHGGKFVAPPVISVMYGIASKCAIVFSVLVPFYIDKIQISMRKKILLIANFVVGAFGSLLSGGRMALFGILVALFVCFYLKKKANYCWNVKINNKKFFVFGMISVICCALTFSTIGQFIGRQSDNSSKYIFAVYCGAELKQLDNYLQSPFFLDNPIFGLNTWGHLISELIPSEVSQKQIELDFETVNGWELGNVKTAFYPMLLDFGNFFPFAVFIEAFLLCALIKKAKSTEFWQTGKLNLWVILCAYMYGSAFLSFFSEQFFSRFTIKWMMSALIYWSMIVYFIQGHLGVNIKIGRFNEKKSSNFCSLP